MMGRPVVAGTRVTVDEILDRLADGLTADQLLALHPGLTAAGILAALRHAADTVRAATPVGEIPPLEMHGTHAVLIPVGTGETRQAAVAIRTFAPEAAGVAVRRIVAQASAGEFLPMERVHSAGIFEALFPGETEPFRYELAVTRSDGRTDIAEDAYSLPPLITDADLRQFAGTDDAGDHPTESGYGGPRWHRILGAHVVEHAGHAGVGFAVWAPNARAVSVIGDFNEWHELRHPLRSRSGGIWDLFVPGVAAGARYKYRITPQNGGPAVDKADPYGFAAELRPQTASIVWDPNGYEWGDGEWIAQRPHRQAPDAPLAIYEVHLGSWRRPPAAEGGSRSPWLSYRELAETLIPYVKELGYTHIEPMPVAEHPFDGSWGYQITGFFAPTSRYGTPDDFRYFVDRAHQAGLGVILDWVPGHFPKDEHGLSRFDGTCLYEHDDPRRSENLEWGTSAFNLDRTEVRAFLLSNALFWLEQYHLDGLRVDAVASMIYLDYSRRHWVPNRLGGRENLEAAAFFRQLNAVVHREHPGALTIAEESTAWPRVTGPETADSLGFDLKWNLGWMHDTLGYLQEDPLFRRHHHDKLTFSLVYAFSENFLLPLSHDEVVHGKCSLLAKLPGDEWQRLAHLRTLYGYHYAHPGKKLLFMGGEFGQAGEWNHDRELEWDLLLRTPHRQVQTWVRDLNRVYFAQAALHEADFGWEGFQWIDCNDAEQSVVSFLRRGRRSGEFVVVVVNFTPVPRKGHRVGVPAPGAYREILNSDDPRYGGSSGGNSAPVASEPTPCNGQPHSLVITLPPLAILFLARDHSGPSHSSPATSQTAKAGARRRRLDRHQQAPPGQG